MPSAAEFRLYVVLDTTDLLWTAYRERNLKEVKAYLIRRLDLSEQAAALFQVAPLPSVGFDLVLVGKQLPLQPIDSSQRELIVGLKFTEAIGMQRFADAAPRWAATGQIMSWGVDLPGYAADHHWCPGHPPNAAFATRSAARRLIGADALPPPPGGASRVNVVVVDRGFNKALLPAGVYCGGWQVDLADYGLPPNDPGTATAHGDMIVRNIIDLAPTARLFDLPIIPPRIDDPGVFLDLAHAALYVLRIAIKLLQGVPELSGPWIVVNAWGVMDRGWEAALPAAGRYSDDPQHPFNRAVANLIADGHDVIFAAGNCGLFCPSRRCGRRDIGPGSSIFGASALKQVITAGAVRSDATWIGLSSQGPGLIEHNKPDFCAPSHFAEDADGHLLSTGTSAACAVTAGVLAALRATWRNPNVTPARMSQALRDSARKDYTTAFDDRYGNGILDVPKTVKYLQANFSQGGKRTPSSLPS